MLHSASRMTDIASATIKTDTAVFCSVGFFGIPNNPGDRKVGDKSWGVNSGD